jgi:hypothetical protein
MTPLPYIDDHEVTVEAPPERVWDALARMLVGARGPVMAAGVHLLGTHPRGFSGPLAANSTIPGFRVAVCAPFETLALEGSHRFSTYALTFRLVAGGATTTLHAESRAAFPGLHGRLYRALVIRSGAHGVAVHAMLERVRRSVRMAEAVG